MYYFGWIFLIAISVWVSLMAFIWALQSGQFSDQARARYLPLSDQLPSTSPQNPSRLPIEVYALLAVGAVALVGMVASLILSLPWLKEWVQ